jgi:acetate kinase
MYEEHRIRRYGFHGTSHRYVALQARKYLEGVGIPADEQKIVTCHLGNGVSVAAVQGGRSIDCSLGFTPLEGLLMGTRSGDLDPAIPLHLIRELGMKAEEVDALLNTRSGLLGISGVSSDMRDVRQAAEAGSERARLAVAIFCYRVRKYIGAYAAAMGGLSAVVFTAGIGENAAAVREKCVESLEFLGLRLDGDRNRNLSSGDAVALISAADSPGYILVIPTDEELMIARDTAQVVGQLQA